MSGSGAGIDERRASPIDDEVTGRKTRPQVLGIDPIYAVADWNRICGHSLS